MPVGSDFKTSGGRRRQRRIEVMLVAHYLSERAIAGTNNRNPLLGLTLITAVLSPIELAAQDLNSTGKLGLSIEI
ncbi:hypothetical protein GN109_15580 [Collimonas pratensis]|uniref:hypothetical protein n=1 Tax=Collimonas pratensis TaxID=279113 RepID=UPI00143E09CA|nr:hypothetical protein [Collimonas pratensis]NKI70844.1 hypothetical protein [Collimonas pratensis]